MLNGLLKKLFIFLISPNWIDTHLCFFHQLMISESLKILYYSNLSFALLDQFHWT